MTKKTQNLRIRKVVAVVALPTAAFVPGRSRTSR